MALPVKALEQLAREPARTPGWSGRLLMFSSTIFFVMLFVYLGIVFGYEPYLRSQVNRLNDRIQGFSQQVSAEDQAKVATFYSQLANVKTLLRTHRTTSPLFSWLEKNTGSNVYYTKLLLNPENRQVTLAGVGKSVGDVASQMLVFQAQPEVERASFNNTGVGQGGSWQFDLTLVLKPEVFLGNVQGGGPVPDGSESTP